MSKNANYKSINSNSIKLDTAKAKADEDFGIYNEGRLELYFKDKGKNICKYKDKWAILDYYRKNKDGKIIKYYELKSRRYNWTAPFIQNEGIAYGKVKFERAKKCVDSGVAVVFYFLMLDGLYAWKLTDYIKQKEEYTFNQFGNVARNDKMKDGIFIQTKYCSLIDKDFCSKEPNEYEFLPDTDDEEEEALNKTSPNGFRLTNNNVECKYQHKCSKCDLSDWYIMPIYGYKDTENYNCSVCETEDRNKEQRLKQSYRLSTKCKCGKNKQSGFVQCFLCNKKSKENDKCFDASKH